MTAIYNEIEPYACDWLENLINAGHIAHGRVERRSIRELQPSDVAGAGQRHFFAGIAGWSLALRMAGIPDDASVWTGSCPCQPFSDAAAGRRDGVDDERHLWPEWFRLIQECRPAVVFGEQVASSDGLGWLDAVSADLEGAGYAVGAADLCAAGVGAPHRRQRLYFMAYAAEPGWLARWRTGVAGDGRDTARLESRRLRNAGELGHSDGAGTGRDAGAMSGAEAAREREGFVDGRVADGVVDASFWGNAEWVNCIDGKRRPIEPGTFPLAHGVPGRVGRLRGFGNAIVPKVAATFIRAALEAS